MSVEKFIISKNSSNYTIIPNKVLQGLRNLEALGLYCYLASLPPGWEFFKEQIQKHADIGRDSLRNLLNILKEHGLIEITRIRRADGTLAHNDLRIEDGSNFIEIKHIVKDPQPETENQCLVNRTYKYNNKKNNTKIFKSYCASDEARPIENTNNIPPPDDPPSRFNEFYSLYPRKRDPKGAAKAWKKNKCEQISDKIIQDVENRIKNDPQWQNKQYIPFPGTYLNNARWEDDITETNHGQSGRSNKLTYAQEITQRIADDLKHGNWI